MDSFEKLIPTFSPQGDGNHCLEGSFALGLQNVDPYLFPARGRKRPDDATIKLEVEAVQLIPTFSPQGDGNAKKPPEHLGMRDVDPYLFPARGRKPVELRKPCGLEAKLTLIPTFSPQGDGNPRISSGTSRSESTLIPTFSPQGDGN